LKSINGWRSLKKRMIDIAIIGAGNLGTSLGYALSKKGYNIKALSCRSLKSLKESQRIIREGKTSTDNIQTAKQGNILFICVPDGEIVKIVKELSGGQLSWREKYVFHCSGLLPSEVMKPLKTRGALTASLHPIQSFSQKKGDLKQFEGIYFGLEGDDKALKLAQKIVGSLGGHSIHIRAQDKPIYHAACSVASNFFVVLLDTAVSLLKHIGLEQKQAFKAVMPLIQGTLRNVKEFNTEGALTGPVIRGEQESVEKHLDALRKFPGYHEMYHSLAAQALEIAKRKNIPPEKIKSLKNLLEGK
jgi:predicted short-subunit dehydrogenase-like oxidoreductase (DUF2520 family)